MKLERTQKNPAICFHFQNQMLLLKLSEVQHSPVAWIFLITSALELGAALFVDIGHPLWCVGFCSVLHQQNYKMMAGAHMGCHDNTREIKSIPPRSPKSNNSN